MSVTISTTTDGQIVFKDQNGKVLGSFVAAVETTPAKEDSFGLIHAATAAPAVVVAAAAAAPAIITPAPVVAPAEPVAEPVVAPVVTPPPPPVVEATNLPTAMQAITQIKAVLKSHGMVS